MSDRMAYPQYRLPGDSSRQSDPPLIAPYFPHNYVGPNEGELVLPLTRLHLHRSSQASNEVGFLITLLYSLKFMGRFHLIWELFHDLPGDVVQFVCAFGFHHFIVALPTERGRLDHYSFFALIERWMDTTHTCG